MKKLVLIFLVTGTAIISAQTDEPTGSLEGKVIADHYISSRRFENILKK